MKNLLLFSLFIFNQADLFAQTAISYKHKPNSFLGGFSDFRMLTPKKMVANLSTSDIVIVSVQTGKIEKQISKLELQNSIHSFFRKEAKGQQIHSIDSMVFVFGRLWIIPKTNKVYVIVHFASKDPVDSNLNRFFILELSQDLEILSTLPIDLNLESYSSSFQGFWMESRGRIYIAKDNQKDTTSLFNLHTLQNGRYVFTEESKNFKASSLRFGNLSRNMGLFTSKHAKFINTSKIIYSLNSRNKPVITIYPNIKNNEFLAGVRRIDQGDFLMLKITTNFLKEENMYITSSFELVRSDPSFSRFKMLKKFKASDFNLTAIDYLNGQLYTIVFERRHKQFSIVEVEIHD